MKQLILLLFLLFSFVCRAQTEKVYKSEEVTNINELFYLVKDSTLVTGKVVRYDGSGEKKDKETTFKEGKYDGLFRAFQDYQCAL